MKFELCECKLINILMIKILCTPGQSNKWQLQEHSKCGVKDLYTKERCRYLVQKGCKMPLVVSHAAEGRSASLAPWGWRAQDGPASSPSTQRSGSGRDLKPENENGRIRFAFTEDGALETWPVNCKSSLVWSFSLSFIKTIRKQRRKLKRMLT